MPPALLLDTHILIRWISNRAKLSKEQLRAIERAVRHAEPVALSAFTLIETAILTSEGKLAGSLREIFAVIEPGPVFQVLPITFKIAEEIALLGSLRDPADRAIVATARVHHLTLVTSDQRIVSSQLVPVID